MFAFISILLRRPRASGAHQGRLFGAYDRVIFRLFIFLQPVEVFLGHGHI